MTRPAILVALVLAVTVTPVAIAAAQEPQDVANEISATIMSPFCPGVTLHDCPSDAAVALRDRITDMAEQGFTRAQIVSALERDYGDVIRATPDPSGAGLVAWLLPALAAAVGAGGVWLLVRRWVRPVPVPAGYDPGAHVTPADRARLDAELRRFLGES